MNKKITMLMILISLIAFMLFCVIMTTDVYNDTKDEQINYENRLSKSILEKL